MRKWSTVAAIIAIVAIVAIIGIGATLYFYSERENVTMSQAGELTEELAATLESSEDGFVEVTSEDAVE